jgi:hypothetical protein
MKFNKYKYMETAKLEWRDVKVIMDTPKSKKPCFVLCQTYTHVNKESVFNKVPMSQAKSHMLQKPSYASPFLPVSF